MKWIWIILFSNVLVAHAQKSYKAIYSGVPWFDDKGNIVSAHGACIVKDKGRYYLFGERHSDTSNAFTGFNCYSSTDLYNWKFERLALPVQDSGRLGPGRVGERVKVMKCPSTGEYMMYMHTDDLTYKDQCVDYASSKNITGPYIFHGPLLFRGQPIRKWDMGAFQDADGAGYILIHGGDIYRLGNDYKSVVEQVNKNMTPGFESPAIFRKDSIYFFLGSHLTSWERNDNYYYTATSLKGPWTYRGLFAPDSTLTWNSQTTFVLPVNDTTFMFMGDRWSFPKQASAATYVWQPLVVKGTSLFIPEYKEAWPLDHPGSTVISYTDVKYSGNWQNGSSDTKDASYSIQFTGTQIGIYGLSQPTGGYARVVLTNSKGKKLYRCIIDTYCKYAVSALQFMSPVLSKGVYILTVTVMGEHGNWSDKRKNNYGSTGNVVALEKIVITM